nr:apoptosis regulatory protein Siva-like isoform X2 [Paramormyrops kingsleyae]
MSKRCCLWSDGTPQRKTCVKDGAAAGEADKKAVYARGQMRIGSRGELLRSPGSAAEPPSSPACTLCERPLQASDSCVRCEKVVCMQCQRRCSLCLRTHCFICCQPNYNERYERMTCIDCLAE